MGNEAVKACPSGYQTRTCGEYGVWSDIDYSNCRCKAMDGFEDTPVNTYANTTCFDMDGVPDEVYTQTRFCGPNGEWGEVDQSQCPVKWCPSEPSWYKVPVGNRPTTVVMGCMSGERHRVCNVNGEWGPVDTSNCNCVYSLEDEIERLLTPGDSYALPCSVGERTYKCNEDSGYFDPVDLSNCKCGTDGRFATTAAGNLASVACSEGTATRICSLNGEWEEVDNTRCFCKGSDVWRQANVNTTVSILCDIGYRSRVCSEWGEWEEPEQDTCKCSWNGLEAAFGTSDTIPCEEGVIEYRCGLDGHFSEPIKDTCFCASREEYEIIWNRLPAGGESAPMNCMNGVTITRTCNATTGHWDALDASVCRCAEEGDWAETGVGEYAFAACSGHATGLARRQCHGNHWGLVDESMCLSECQYDAGTGEIVYIPVGETREFDCYVNLAGSETYRCQYDEEAKESVLVKVNSTCVRLNCPTDLPPFYVDAGETESRPCPEGFRGNRTRVCQTEGEWSDYDMSGCEALICPAITVDGFTFNMTLAGVYAKAECPEGYSGNRKLYCDLNGNWNTTIIMDCTKNICPAEDGWPETEALANSTIACPSDYTGTWTRKCLASGEWEPYVIPDSCIPIPPAIKTMPYEGMKHVSRTPSAALFSSLAIRNANASCAVSIQSTTRPEEVYTLEVNRTKTAMVGRYRNGGVFADFVLSENDLYDPEKYLGYGEYKVIFYSCWEALNGAPIPDADLEVTFHTAPVPPSAPVNITLRNEASSFYVTFEAPLYVDEAYPVTGYYLAFQPPIRPEIYVDASHHSFGPFPYFAGQVTLLLRAENAYGLSSPDVEVPYSFDDILVDAMGTLQIPLPAPIISLRRQMKSQTNTVSVTVAVAAPVELHDYVRYLEVTCASQRAPDFTSAEPVEFTTSVMAGEDYTILCYFTLGAQVGENGVFSGSSDVPDAPYAAVAVQAEEVEAQVLRLTWEQPVIYTASPIAGYRVECRLANDVDPAVYPIAFNVTAEEALFSAANFNAGPVLCRVAAIAQESLELGAWGEVTIPELHAFPTSMSMSVEVQGVTLLVRLSSSYCVGATATVSHGASTVSQAMQCSGDAITATFYGLEANTFYDVSVMVPAKAMKFAASVSTAAPIAASMDISAESSLLSSSVAVLKVVTDIPESVYCLAHTTSLSPESIQAQAEAGLFEGRYEPSELSEPVLEHQIVLTDLQPSTAYHVSCIARSSHTVKQAINLFTTPATVSPLHVVEVESVHPLSHKPTFRLTFDDHIMLGEAASASAMCGGLALDAPLAIDATAPKQNVAVVSFDALPASSSCVLFFSSLAAVRRASFYRQETGLLSETPFFNNTASFAFSVSTDSIRPALRTLAIVKMSESAMLFATTSEALLDGSFEYEVSCHMDGEPSVHRTFHTADYPLEVRSGRDAKEGYMDVLLYAGLLPHMHTCQLLFPADAVTDRFGNAVQCQLSEDRCVYEFVVQAAQSEGRIRGWTGDD